MLYHWQISSAFTVICAAHISCFIYFVSTVHFTSFIHFIFMLFFLCGVSTRDLDVNLYSAPVSITLLICIVDSDEKNTVLLWTRQQQHKGRNKAKVGLNRIFIQIIQWKYSLLSVTEDESADSQRQVKSGFMLESKLQRPSVRLMTCKPFLSWHPRCMFSYIIHDTTTWYQICLSEY